MTQANEATTAATVTPVRATDAYRVTGTSPTVRVGNALDRTRHAPRESVRRRDYDTIHVLGVGGVGRALLELCLSDRRRVVAVTDSTATLHDSRGIDIPAITAWKLAGRPLRDHPFAVPVPAVAAIASIDADVVVDATATDLDRPGWTSALSAALVRGACVASAAKAALCDAGAEWLTGEHRARVGCNAVLGGTGRSFIAELPELQKRTRSIAVVGNASTTVILQVVEGGGTLADGIAEAQRLGYIEPDPELDLRGADAAVKLAIVAGIITGHRMDPRTIETEDIREVDVLAVRARARRHATTRLVGRLDGSGRLRVGYEELSRDSILAAPCGRVVYEYGLTGDERRLHIGSGLGAAATARALFADIRALAAEAASLANPEAAR